MSFTPSDDTLAQLSSIDELQKKCLENHLTIYHCGSWAVTALYGKFFKEMSDIDLVVETKSDKEKLCRILEDLGYRHLKNADWGKVYKKGNLEVEFGSADDSKNSAFFGAVPGEKSCGEINGVKLYTISSAWLLKNRLAMLESGYKKMDKTQKFIIKILQDYMARTDSD